jgi:hypothetical protein
MDENTNKYTFPFNTCEQKNENGIAQPYSSLVNFVNCLIILKSNKMEECSQLD